MNISSLRQAVVLAVLTVVVAGGVGLMWRTAAAERWTIEHFREIGGDVLVLKYSRDFQEVREVAKRIAIAPGVVRSEPFTVATVHFATDRVQVDGLLKAASVRIERTGSLPGVIAGTGLLRRLGVTAGESVEIRPRTPAEATVAAPVRCAVVGTKRFRLEHANDNLSLASFDQLEQFGLLPTGVDVWLDDVDAGRDLARDLQSELGPQYQALSLFDMHLNVLGPLRIKRRVYQGALALAVATSMSLALTFVRRQRGNARSDEVVSLSAVAAAWLFGMALGALFVPAGVAVLDRSHINSVVVGPSFVGFLVGVLVAFLIGRWWASRDRRVVQPPSSGSRSTA